MQLAELSQLFNPTSIHCEVRLRVQPHTSLHSSPRFCESDLSFAVTRGSYFNSSKLLSNLCVFRLDFLWIALDVRRSIEVQSIPVSRRIYPVFDKGYRSWAAMQPPSSINFLAAFPPTTSTCKPNLRASSGRSARDSTERVFA